ncbi:hypothetical protein COCON_G00211720 [Conger conger]|uniref:TIR domain-containing protein n=1 Tax=Conger conger TaxID=82655 RepID=A0A9Q1D061_CONCO|nr:hypothetical protein COCON_G00211720 [Conger conger]
MFAGTKPPAVSWALCLCGLALLCPSVTKVSEAVTYRSCYPNVRNPTSIFCQNQGIKQLDLISDLPNDTWALNFSNNLLSRLPAKAFFSLPSLEQLRLDRNRISTIEKAAFLGLSSLTLLNLSTNSLKVFPLDAAESLTRLTHLILRGNCLTALCVQGFLHSAGLRFLDISHNPLGCGKMSCLANLTSLVTLRARRIANNCSMSPFSLPGNLTQLDLSHNGLSEFPVGASGGPVSIRDVDLSHNDFSSPKALADLRPASLDLRNNSINVAQLLLDLSWAPGLQRVSLSRRPKSASIRRICESLAGRRATALKLTDVDIAHPGGDFQHCSSLQHLDVSGNRIKNPTLFSREPLRSLRTLHMANSHLASLQFCNDSRAHVSLPNLTFLSLLGNHVYNVPDNAFSGMCQLEFLSLEENRISYIGTTAFSCLGQLSELVLSGNAITSLYNATFQNLHSLKALRLRNNLLTVLFAGILRLPSLLKLDLGGNKLQSVQNGSFQDLPNITDLYLDRNQLQTVTRAMLLDLRQLQVLDLVSNNLRFSAKEEPFGDLASLRSLKLSRQEPHGIRNLPGDVFTGLGKLRQLDLSSNKLYSLSNLFLSPLPNLVHLKMTDMCNGIVTLPNTTFSFLSNLTVLIMENFGLAEVRDKSFQIPTLRDLVLTNNMLQTIPDDFGKSMPRLRYLDVRFNPLACTCANKNFKLWALTSTVHVILFYNITCPSTSATPNHTELLANWNPDRVCPDQTGLWAFSLSVALVLAMLVGGLGYGKGRWYILYAYYTLRIGLKETQLRKTRPKKHRYDAFVSYCSQDEEWVFKELLCLHHRDFEPGKTIVSNIVEAIYSSRKTLCLVSPQYLSSTWCSMEVQVALYRLFDEKNDLLVLVFLEPPPAWALSSFHRLGRVVRRRTYLEWPQEPRQQPFFWARLRLALQLPESLSLV